jgi:hypothetical protein
VNAVTAVDEEMVPVVLARSVQQFRDHLGAVLREVDGGAIVRIRNGKEPGRVYWVTNQPPPELHGREHMLPDVQQVDALGLADEPDPEPDPGWVVREGLLADSLGTEPAA